MSDKPFFICGPCVIEGDGTVNLETAKRLADIASKLGVQLCFKSSFQKDNRTSGKSYRGVSREQAQQLFDRIRQECNLPVTTDVHSVADIYAMRAYVDVLQIPALLSRQTSLLEASAKYPGCVTIKRGGFVNPDTVGHMVDKVRAKNPDCNVGLIERGTMYASDNVVDYRAIPRMKRAVEGKGVPVIFDASHTSQYPQSNGDSSGGDRRLVAPLAIAAAAFECQGFFYEVHPDPDKALCDGPSMIPLSEAESLMRKIIQASDLHGFENSGGNACPLWVN